MRLLYVLLFCFPLNLLLAQTTTTDEHLDVVVDSLIKLSINLTDAGTYPTALIEAMNAMKIVESNKGLKTPLSGLVAYNIGRVYDFMDDYPNAVQWYEQARIIQEETLPPNDSNLGKTYSNLAGIKYKIGEYERARILLVKALTIWERTVGKDHPFYFMTAANLARVYSKTGRFDKAENLGQEVLLKKKIFFGDRHKEYAKSLGFLAELQTKGGSFLAAEISYLEALQVLKGIGLSESIEYADILLELANNDLQIGQFQKARERSTKALDIIRLIKGVDDPAYANAMISLAGQLILTSDFDQAESLAKEAIAIRSNHFGKESALVAYDLVVLASIHMQQGEYAEAEQLFQQSSNISKKISGVVSDEYATSLFSLGVLYWTLGQYNQSEDAFHLSDSILIKLHGPEDPSRTPGLINLASVFRVKGQLEESERVYLQVRKSVLASESPNHLINAIILNNLGDLYLTMGDMDRSSAFFYETKQIMEDRGWQEFPEYALCLHNLGNLHLAKGEFDISEEFLLKANDYLRDRLGREHPYYLLGLSSLGTLYGETSELDRSINIFEEALNINQALITKAVSFQTEAELAQFLKTNNGLQSALFSTLYRHPDAHGLVALAYNLVLLQKGFLLYASRRARRLAEAQPETRDILVRLTMLQGKLGQILTTSDSANIVPLLESEVQQLEKELTLIVGGFKEAMYQVTHKEIQSKLKKDEVAIEFYRFPLTFVGSHSDSVMYIALVHFSDKPSPVAIPLFEENDLGHILNYDKERKSDYVNELYAWADRGMVKLGHEKKSLYDLIWSKIEAAGLEEIKTVYYSPSGVLHRLNLGAIAMDDESILSDRYNLVALNSTRQLVMSDTFTVQTNDAIILGGADFEAANNTAFEETAALHTSRTTSIAGTESGNRVETWSYLKWTEKEVKRIATTLAEGQFKATQLTGAEATEEAIKVIGTQNPSPRALHMATHGFFFPDPEFKNEGIGLEGAEPVFKSSDNPMIRSGLILAGGNYAWQRGRAVSPEKEDGILTAYEISQMNLSNTELVVLSACETGLGDIQGNEGVYGLQRAFKIAGAKYLIMTLWRVEDQITMEFMTTFYRNWLEEALTIPDAFRKTQREMRDRFINPYSWAGFVLVE